MYAMSKEKAPARAKYDRLHTSDPLANLDPQTRERVGQLENYIMRNCLWQFNSRGWDRRKQNAGVLGKTVQLLCGEEVDNPTPQDRCYWVDAVCLADAYRKLFPWLAELDNDGIKFLISELHKRMDWLTIDGSLNEELIVQNY
ncbi:MAG: Fe-only nitrogenase subunit delta [Isosphaeraceae bacterium]